MQRDSGCNPTSVPSWWENMRHPTLSATVAPTSLLGGSGHIRPAASHPLRGPLQESLHAANSEARRIMLPSLQAGYLHRLWGTWPGNVPSGPPGAARLLIYLPRTHAVHQPRAVPTAHHWISKANMRCTRASWILPGSEPSHSHIAFRL